MSDHLTYQSEVTLFLSTHFPDTISNQISTHDKFKVTEVRDKFTAVAIITKQALIL